MSTNGQSVGVAMEGVFRLLLRLGYPTKGVDYLRRFRAPTVVSLAILAWLATVLFILGTIWLVTKLH
jgi:hypothetical protein